MVVHLGTQFITEVLEQLVKVLKVVLEIMEMIIQMDLVVAVQAAQVAMHFNQQTLVQVVLV